MIYCHAVLPTAGLGNKLFPWARCLVYASGKRYPVIAPQWSQFKMGHLLRGEMDARIYANLFRAAPGEITGLNKMRLNLFSKKIGEKEAGGLPIAGAKDDVIVRFDGIQYYFSGLNEHHAFLYKALLEMTVDRWLAAAKPHFGAAIGMHIRHGDFVRPVEGADAPRQGNVRTPIGWFVDCVNLIRAAAGPVKTVVLSDGSVEDLSMVLRLENTSLVRTGSAIGDMLVLSNCKVLLGSGSTFSGWASLFGQMPTITYPGQDLKGYHLDHMDGSFLGTFDPGRPDKTFLDQSAAALRKK